MSSNETCNIDHTPSTGLSVIQFQQQSDEIHDLHGPETITTMRMKQMRHLNKYSIRFKLFKCMRCS